MKIMHSVAARAYALGSRHWKSLTVGVAVIGGGLAGSANAFATGAVYSIGSVVTSTQSNLADDIPIILGILGALIALAWAIRFVTKHVGSAKG
jgi:hypothetical protein